MTAQNARDIVAKANADERANLANRSAHAQSLPLGGTPTLLQLGALDEIARAAVAEFQRRADEINNGMVVAGTGRLVLLGGTMRSGNVATSLYFEVEVASVEALRGSALYDEALSLSQFWIDASGHYAFESPDAHLYEDPTDDDCDEE